MKKDKDPDHAVFILNEFIKAIYLSTPEYIRKKDSSACDLESMSSYTCGKEEPWKSTPWMKKIGG